MSVEKIYNKDLCDERHENLDKILDEHGRRLDVHDAEIGTLKVNEGIHQTEINQLCTSISNLVSTTKVFIGLIATSVLGFFFYAIEQHLFK